MKFTGEPVRFTGEPVTFTYTNYRGETRERRVHPLYLWWGSTAWHKECWMIHATDLETGETRDFALDGITPPR